ncbi:MAG TPA: D-alanyl-lipoteichoic acid biosynthesis protein DltB [Chthoniobacterales bacterium]
MIPYADFSYFGIVAILALPVLILRWLGKDTRLWLIAASVVMIALCSSRESLIAIGAFSLAQYAVVYGFKSLCGRFPARTRARKWALTLGILALLLPLIVCRFTPFFAKGISIGFLGISYVTFRSLDVLFGLSDGLIASLDAVQLFAFLFFFPPLSSGPIDRYRRFGKDWLTTTDRSRLLPDMDNATRHIFRGFFYKFILASLIKEHWLDSAAVQPGALGMISYMYAYSAFLFFDFAGYSAFAVGVSHVFGIATPENFDKPFLARNIRDFWTRWHMSLSFWFRDHVYMRFVLAAAKGKWFSSTHMASHVGYLLTFGLMGLWHGLAPNFLIYGLYHAVLLVGYDIFKRWNQAKRWIGDGLVARSFSIVLTSQAVCFGFLIFSGHLNLGPGTAHPKVKAGLHASAAPHQSPIASVPPHQIYENSLLNSASLASENSSRTWDCRRLAPGMALEPRQAG